MGIDHPKGIMKNIVPIVMAGVLGIYGLIVAVIITQGITTPGDDGNTYSTYNGYTHVSRDRRNLPVVRVFLRRLEPCLLTFPLVVFGWTMLPKLNDSHSIIICSWPPVCAVAFPVLLPVEPLD